LDVQKEERGLSVPSVEVLVAVAIAGMVYCGAVGVVHGVKKAGHAIVHLVHKPKKES
jgi:hypothetical protein